MEFELSEHAKDVIKERGIKEEWVWETLKRPDKKEIREDNNFHYFKKIPEWESRVLHVVVYPDTFPQRVITVFFDRREVKNEIKS